MGIMALMYDHVQADTIAAIATAMSEAGIGIIRISGPDAAAVGSKRYDPIRLYSRD